MNGYRQGVWGSSGGGLGPHLPEYSLLRSPIWMRGKSRKGQNVFNELGRKKKKMTRRCQPRSPPASVVMAAVESYSDTPLLLFVSCNPNKIPTARVVVSNNS